MFSDEPAIFQVRGPYGVPIRFGASLLLLGLLVVPLAAPPGQFGIGLAVFLMLLGSILLHELGHALGAAVLGHATVGIALHAGGGTCRRDRPASLHEAELIVAMGPIVNLTLWAAAGLAASALPAGELAWFLETLSRINLFLALLNLLPVLPLDGGKLLQLTLLRRLDARRATRITGAVGLALAIVWIPLMVASAVWLGLVLVVLPPVSAHWLMLRQPSR